AVGIGETDGRGRVVTGATEEVSYTGVRTIDLKITDTGTLSMDGDWICGTSY
ncbi:hypothetical protein Tco_0068533, partial [Tanacetum coccineum]